ncbi:glycosyltransferase [Pontibacter silvestris]|uniref:Glycosyltransferase n=1 Tax=Pontibacter silvestris TaxID=2305183 RepID=A0ABW4WXB4_9BACT|nr:glycosyltransferase [Pontibacter silvestris]MCC9138550.1 glycosyltransferase [Pontibacter silvestris]
MESYKPFVSIIIPTYKDWDRLLLCVNALLQQSYPKAFFEVIIVNNNPEDKAPWESSLPNNFMILEEETPGSYAARNTGVKASKGQIVGFTDSDCIPALTWIEAAVAFFEEHPATDRIGGRVDLFPLESKYTLAEAYEAVFAFRQEENVKKQVSVTANMFSRKKVFDKIGLFNSTMFSGGDFEWGIRAGQNGYKIGYSSNVVVNHPARRDLKQLLNKIKRVASGKHSMDNNKKNATVRYISFLYEMRPHVKEFRHIYTRGKALNFNLKMRVFMLRYYIRVLRAYEEIRLFNGSKPYYDIQ